VRDAWCSLADERHWFVPCGEQERRDIKLKEGTSMRLWAGLGILKTPREMGGPNLSCERIRVEMVS